MALSFNKRVFGGTIEESTKQKLTTRQNVLSKEQAPGDLASKEILNTDSLSGGFEGSSRTVFARMWTAIEAIPALNQKEIKKLEAENTDINNILNISNLEKAVNKLEQDEIAKQNLKPKTYIVGNYSNESIKINNPVQNGNNEVVFDEFLQNNDFLKQDAGITRVAITTEGSLGAILNTTVDFKVNNFKDFENIFSKHFLSPGATVVVDVGWNNVEIYDPNILIQKNSNVKDILGNKGLLEILYTSTDDNSKYGNNVVENSNGDLLVLGGKVIDYSSKVNTDGTWDCSLTIVSSNRGLLDQNLESENNARQGIVDRIETLILLTAAETYRQLVGGDGDVIFTLDELMEVPITALNGVNNLLAKFFYSDKVGDDYKLPSQSIVLGVHIPVTETPRDPIIKKDNTKVPFTVYKITGTVYVSWGWLEDNILNRSFTVSTVDKNSGESFTDTIGGQSFNSNNSYVKSIPIVGAYIEQLLKEGKSPAIIFPNNYDESWNSLVNKLPDDVEKTEGRTTLDKSRGRIPLREIFFNLDIIKENLQKEKFRITDALQSIFDDINSEFPLYDFDFLSYDKTFNSLSVVEKSSFDKKTEFKEDEFIFKPLSDNSMVHEFDISYQTPSGELQSMIAIQSTSPNQNLVGGTTTQRIHAHLRRIAMKKNKYFFKHMETPKQTLSLQRTNTLDVTGPTIPSKNIGDGAAVAFGDEDKIKEIRTRFNSLNLDLSVEQARQSIELKNKKDKKPGSTNNTDVTDEVRTTAAFLKNLMTKQTALESPLLPYNLKLTIFGTHGIYPGDLVNVDYLPLEVINRATFVVTKVSHEISSGTWKTSLETQMKLKPVDQQLTPEEIAQINTLQKNPAITDVEPEVTSNKVFGPQAPPPQPVPNNNPSNTNKNFGGKIRTRLNLEGKFKQAFITIQENPSFQITPDLFLDKKQTYFSEYWVKRMWLAGFQKSAYSARYAPKAWPVPFFSSNTRVQTIYKKYGYEVQSLAALFGEKINADFSDFKIEGQDLNTQNKNLGKNSFYQWLGRTTVCSLTFELGKKYVFVEQTDKIPAMNFFLFPENVRPPEPWYGVGGSATPPADWNPELFGEWNNDQVQHITQETGTTQSELSSMNNYLQIIAWRRTTRGALQSSYEDDIRQLSSLADQYIQVWGSTELDAKVSQAIRDVRNSLTLNPRTGKIIN